VLSTIADRNLHEIKPIRLYARDAHPSVNQPLQSGTLSTIAAKATNSTSTLISTLVSKGDVRKALNQNFVGYD
jgi:hypothetical protein